MKIRNLVAAVLLACAALGATSSPASAGHTEFCVAQGTMTTSRLYYPLVGPSGEGGSFVMYTTPDATVCTGLIVNLIMEGTFGLGLVAYCDRWTGFGTVNGHSAIFELDGSVLIVEGTPALNGNVMYGVFSVIPDALNGQSCISGSTGFLVTGYMNFVA